MSAFARQFVSLKIVTDNNAEWRQWSRQYPMTGNAIPQLYVVRADGEQLYGGAGSLPGDALPQMLLASVKRAGRFFTEEQAKFLYESVEASEQSLMSGNLLVAGVRLADLLSLGSPSDLQSYAASALKASELHQELRLQIEEAVNEANDDLQNPENVELSIQQIIPLCEAEAIYEMFPQWRADAKEVTRELGKEDRYKPLLDQAADLVRARVAASSSQVRLRGRAPSLFANVMRKYPDTKAASMARAELLAIDPDSKWLDMNVAANSASITMVEFREWSTLDGNFRTTAKLLQQESGKVQLLKDSGEIISVDVRVLSQRDQLYLKEMKR
ncbi:MAG: hypothetical protein L7U72_17900 [Rubripirellula sp.]|nr:hypothetical protein [Rubripirellula sp.]